MDNNVFEVLISKEAPSDDNVTVCDQYFSSGELVEPGDILGSVETSKATIDIEAEVGGYVHYACDLQDEVKVGSIFAYISIEKDFSIPSPKNEKKEVNTDGVLISAKAKELINKHDISPEVFVNMGFVREVDILEYLNAQSVDTPASFSFSENDIVILGGGGHARMCLDVIESNRNYKFAGFVDDNPMANLRDGLKRIGKISDSRSFRDQGLKNIILGIGYLNNMKKRKALYDELVTLEYNIPNIVHSKSLVSG